MTITYKPLVTSHNKKLVGSALPATLFMGGQWCRWQSIRFCERAVSGAWKCILE